MVHLEEFLGDILEMVARSGWEPLLIEQLLIIKRERRYVRLSWNYAFIEFAKYVIPLEELTCHIRIILY